MARPNILFILADQHRADCLSCAGHPDVRTPHIDSIARAGVRYANCFCTLPVCTPSRYSLLSGRYVHETRCWDNHCTLLPEVPTFPRTLREIGYRTAAIGKMHFTPTYLDVGFDRLTLCEQHGDGRWDDDYHRMLMEKGLVDVNDQEDQVERYRKAAPPEYWSTRGCKVSNLPDALHSTTWIGDRAIDELESWSKERPNLLMVGFVKPHHPMDPPAPWDQMYDPAQLTIPPDYTPQALERDLAVSTGFFPHADLNETALRKSLALYYATISHLDREVGRMLDCLEKRGLLDNTVVVYAADHGDYAGCHHMMLKGGTMYDPLVRVPLIIRYPGQAGRARAGEVAPEQVSLVDLAGTLCAQGEVEFPAGKDEGLDLALPRAERDIVFAEEGCHWPEVGTGIMARTRGSKLIRATIPGKLSLFFDLKADPYELNNRMYEPACQNEIMRLEAAIRRWRGHGWRHATTLDENAPQIRQPNVAPTPNDRAAARARLQAFTWSAMKKAGYDAPQP
ncbi:MAG TPA: sulfatase-like hydrolase/transferase [Planctomycetota bacterium]|nr:sulfatase-like hydrolase/transferase [Planctomycetota bacterium]